MSSGEDASTVYELIRTLADDYSEVRSLSELYEVTAERVKEEMDADFGMVAESQQGSTQALATEPQDWTDTDNLLWPVSLPHIAASQGQAYIIDDKSNVRSAVQLDSTTHDADVEYPSILWAPFGEQGYLLAGARHKSVFCERDLERLRVISVIADLVRQRIEESAESVAEHDTVDEAAKFLSHDAKNLLDVIQGRLQLAQETPQDEHLATIHQNLERLEELIADTVLLMQTGDHLTERQPVSLERTAQNAWRNIDRKEAHLSNYADETISADESRLCQLFENLFRNAVEHAAPDVDISLGTLDDGHGFYIMDDGPGIEPADADALFELGYSTNHRNTGLGLTIVKRIAEAHGWDVTVMNGEYGGARFEFRGVEFVAE